MLHPLIVGKVYAGTERVAEPEIRGGAQATLVPSVPWLAAAQSDYVQLSTLSPLTFRK